MKKYALISVSDKTGLVDFAKRIADVGYEILATGNTAKTIKENGINCTNISDFTKFPEVFSGRVKTLQPTIFGGILMRRDDENDQKQAEENNIAPIDIVCVNLYPFPQVVNRDDISLAEKIENIDIGGPSLIRASAKNYKYVSILTNPEQYTSFLTELEGGEVSSSTRENLAYAAFSHTAYYDTLISNYFEKEFSFDAEAVRLNYKALNPLRYGENPHQSAKMFGDFYDYFEVKHGKELSYNNIIDLAAAVELVQDLGDNSCAIIKHTNPCGAATRDNIYDAYVEALSCDPVSSFGGIVAFNEKVNLKTAEKLNEIFLEIIVAPDFDEDAFELLTKKKNRRLVKVLKELKTDPTPNVKNIPGGLMIQDKDHSVLVDENLKLATKREYTEDEYQNLKFAWAVCKHTKSNAIVYVKDKKAVGVGAGQMSRVYSARIAAEKAVNFGHDLKGAVAASDAFFPFADGLMEIISKGVTAVIQPGGSVRDDEVIEAADKNNVSMVFTGIRNFKH